jgi:hypothetical protein
VLGILLSGIVALWFATDAQRPEMARLVFSSMLPLLGTWVGTVLAFYFAKENLQAATDSTVRLASQFGPTTAISTAMIPRGQIVAYTLQAGTSADTVPLDALTGLMTAGQRVPIFNANGGVVYVVHKSSIDAFAGTLAEGDTTAGKTMADLRLVPRLKAAVEAIATVPPNGVLADARAAMRSVSGCNDVFVTTDGGRDSQVVGWLTNTLLAGAH